MSNYNIISATVCDDFAMNCDSPGNDNDNHSHVHQVYCVLSFMRMMMIVKVIVIIILVSILIITYWTYLLLQFVAYGEGRAPVLPFVFCYEISPQNV